ncbi:hypothetical protein [Phaeobacter sp. 11ANDIMAR09]|uniref:hypothetical protein n=1 Tax=Phaeobacter sp. 11ANDIMAR09 TaxID=1225647 RepID=UPI0006C87E28|nr:hypothetical protein [Phaeobacter sp. 11ANDIMAR09]KPD10864.1 hypothetical protein AN476_18590 [Phaeobacter sp. 11ANDIMAR09]
MSVSVPFCHGGVFNDLDLAKQLGGHLHSGQIPGGAGAAVIQSKGSDAPVCQADTAELCGRIKEGLKGREVAFPNAFFVLFLGKGLDGDAQDVAILQGLGLAGLLGACEQGSIGKGPPGPG